MRKTKYIFFTAIIITIVGFSSCQQPYGSEQLANAERIMESHPDSSYKILLDIDKYKLRDIRSRAKYALLMSMALDKNYIDTTTFDVLQPAIDYFLATGTPDEKLKTYYYQGRIYQNAGDKDNALRSYMRALDNSDKCKDSLVLARTYVAQGILYHDFYDIDSYIENSLKAARIYRLLSIPNRELDCMLNALTGYILKGNKEKSKHLILSCDSIVNKGYGDVIEEKLIPYKLKYAIKFGNSDDIRQIISSKNLNNIRGIDNALDIALAYNKTKDDMKAKQVLDYVNSSGYPFDTLKYLAIYVSICQKTGDYKEAYTMYHHYNQKLDSINRIKIDKKSKITEEVHNLELRGQEEKRQKTQIIWGSLCCTIFLTLIISILILIARNNMHKKEIALEKLRIKDLENSNLKAESDKLAIEKEQLNLENKNLQLENEKKVLEAENLANKVDFLEAESEKLKNIIETQHNLPPEVEEAIKKRIEMLNSLLASYITDNTSYEKAYEDWVKEITENSEVFMNNNRLAFQASHPKFIKYFENHGLNTSELNYVCLYAIGLRGKEVGNYIKKRSHVNISSTIRKKLGIDVHETNLGIYVRKLLKSL